jgi:hypothetical protein
MTITITFQNVEKLVFFNHELKKKLSSFRELFQTWALSQQSPELRPLGQRATIDFCNSVTDEHIGTMQEFFNDAVEVKKINNRIAEHRVYDIAEAEEKLNAEPILKETFFLYREGDQLYISTWR